MKRIKIIGMSLVAACVIGLVGAASATAHATNNPQWQILSKVLKAGETAGLQAEQVGTQRLSFTGLTIECTKLSLASGAVLGGSNAPAPGTSLETIVYSNCTVAGFVTCKINGANPGTIETKPLRGLLVFLTKEGALQEDALASGTLFEPDTGKVFAQFHLLEPGLCPLTGALPIEGTGVLVKNLNATTLSLAKEIEAPATAITKYFVNEPGLLVKEKPGIKLTVTGMAAVYNGKVRSWLQNDDLWEVFN